MITPEYLEDCTDMLNLSEIEEDDDRRREIGDLQEFGQGRILWRIENLSDADLWPFWLEDYLRNMAQVLGTIPIQGFPWEVFVTETGEVYLARKKEEK